MDLHRSLLFYIIYIGVISTPLVYGETPNLFGVPGEGYIVETLIGTPPQKLNVLVDTGSSNFAVAAAPNPSIEKYFECNGSNSLIYKATPVSVLYTQGSWTGELASDVVLFPTLNSVTEVRCDIALIQESENFYMNQSRWQGILGVAFPEISRPDSLVLTWIDYLQKANHDRTMAFSLTLCGAKEDNQNEHFGYFEILNNVMEANNALLTTPVIKEWFYEVVMTGLAVGNKTLQIPCRIFNEEKTIIDSGTTNLRLPSPVFENLVQELLIETKLVLNDSFWSERQMICWDSRMDWDKLLPRISIDLMRNSNEYFSIELPGNSYIRRIPSDKKFCYKLGIERTVTGTTILGVVLMEGLEVQFNRTGKTVGFMPAHCGPNVRITGPHITDRDLVAECSRSIGEKLSMLEVFAYIVCSLLLVTALMFSYLMVQWLKEKFFRLRRRLSTAYVSQSCLISEEVYRQ